MRTLALALLVALAACGKPTELLVVFSTDYAHGQYDQLTIEVRGRGGDAGAYSHTYLVPAETTLPASLELHPHDGNPTVTIDATLFYKSAPLVTRRAIVPFVEHRALELRLVLQQACAPVACSDGDTCVDGACTSAQVDPSTLAPIPSDPLALVDMSVADLATPPLVDLATPTTDLGADMQPSTDMAMTCPSIPAPTATGCVVTTFGVNDTQPNMISKPTDVMTSRVCGNRLRIQMPRGGYAFGHDFYVEPDATPLVGAYTFSAGYAATTSGTAYAGIRAVDGDMPAYWFEFATTKADLSGDRFIASSNKANPPSVPLASGTTNTSPSHVITMTRGLNGTSSTYDLAVSSALPIATTGPLGLTQAQVPQFFVGSVNDGSLNAIDVQLAWIAYCPQ